MGIMVSSSKVSDGTEKKDLLLACGSFELQEIFFSIPGADVEANEEQGIDPYAVAIGKLDEYFAPQRHEAHERILFWNMKPEPDESIDKFLVRVQAHGSKCNFGKTELGSAGIAVVDKMLQFVPNQLRVRLLQEQDLTLAELVRQVNSFEASRSANDQFSGNNNCPGNSQASDAINYVATPCACCGFSHNHQYCPAQDKACAKCGKRGHFAVVCRSTSIASTSENFNKRHSFNRNAFKRPQGNVDSFNTGPVIKR